MSAARLLAWLAVAGFAAGSAWSGDPAAAERKYSVARRLAAERSPDAVAALREVVALDPQGARADDALVDVAVALGAPGWPEELGGMSAARREEIDEVLAGVMALRSGDRTAEAEYRAALVELEPLAGYDAAAARRGLLAAGARADSGEWGTRARYALGWIDALAADSEAARGAWTRVALEHPGSEAARRALVGLARLDLRAGRSAEAALTLHRAVEGGASDPGTGALRELAVRNALASAGAGASWNPLGQRTAVTVEGLREVAGIAIAPDGRVWLADARRGEIVEVEAGGGIRRRGAFEGLKTISIDPAGRLYLAAGTAVYRLDSAGPTTIVDLGRSGPAAALAVDGSGTVYAADRRGERVLRVTPGSQTPQTLWEAGDVRIAALAWDGFRLLVGDAKTGDVFELAADGARGGTLVDAAEARVDALAVDPSGRFAVCDGRARRVSLYDAAGRDIAELALIDAGLSRPSGCALGPDGSLWTVDSEAGALVRFP